VNSDQTKNMVERVERLRRELESLVEEAEAFPAIRRNALRAKASVRMMEINLGLGLRPTSGAGT